MDSKSFFFTVKWQNAHKLMKKLDKKKVSYLYISEWGAVPCNGHSDEEKLVIDVSDDKWSYVATPDFLDKSDVFVRLRKPNEKPKKLPNFNDVFKVKKL